MFVQVLRALRFGGTARLRLLAVGCHLGPASPHWCVRQFTWKPGLETREVCWWLRLRLACSLYLMSTETVNWRKFAYVALARMISGPV